VPYIIHREDGITVAVDEIGPRLIITRYDGEQAGDVLLALVPLPHTGIEILDWSQGKGSQPDESVPEVAEWAKRSDSSRGNGTGWRRSA
jgi:hypothetical protein